MVPMFEFFYDQGYRRGDFVIISVRLDIEYYNIELVDPERFKRISEFM